ncbi:MAG: DNA-directed DNA polymerase [Candidatus Micrarchaeota archaeon]
MKSRKAYLLSLSYTVKKGKTYVSLLLKGKKTVKLYYQYDPYFLVDAPLEVKEDLLKMNVPHPERTISPIDVQEIERTVGIKNKKLLKVLCSQPSDVPFLKRAIPFPSYEYDIPFVRRFIFDLQLTPNGLLHYQREGAVIKKIISCEPATPPLTTLAFDIETYNPLGAPRAKKDPMIMVSYCDGNAKGVVTYKKTTNKHAETLKGEKEVIERLSEIVKKQDPDVLLGYNSGNFDLPYLQERANLLNAHFSLGRKNGKMAVAKRGMINGMRIANRVHVDLYPIIRLFGFIGILKTAEYTLDAVASEVLGKKKLRIKGVDIWKLWDGDKVDELVEYALMDAELTKALGDTYLPLELELSSMTKMPLFDASLSTSGQFVENLLMFNASKENELIPSKPIGEAIGERLANPIKGAFVKLPEPGVYENIAVLDFRGLYPSIIVSYNIDPRMLVEDDEKGEFHISPVDAKFRKSPQGLIPKVLEQLTDFRADLKKKLKTLDKDSDEYKVLSARVQAVKILSNSFYGYTAYARSRWYCRKCGESVTAYARKHIGDVISAAEEKGFKVLYADTDSVFLIYKTKKDVLDFMDEINKLLPAKMELELESFYTRGVFVGKKGGGEVKGAKKKYALLGDDGRIKIRGFELVRRDWSPIAKDTQYRVLEVILKEGSKEKAAAIVRESIERVMTGKVTMDELTIITQLNKDPREGYEVKSPELGAARKMMAKGIPMETRSVVSFVIGKKGKTISEKAMPASMATDYDADYYINNQILPAVLKILKELGYDEYALKKGGKQRSLDSFFG